MIKKILPLLLMLLFVSTVYADTYMGLKPGTSTKEDADRVLGKPIREVIKGVCFDYSPKEHQARRLSLKFTSEAQVIETINIYFIESYSKEQLKEMFDLGKPSKAVTGEDGTLTEYYGSKGLSFHFTGSGNDAPADFFSHYDQASTPWVKPPVKPPGDGDKTIRKPERPKREQKDQDKGQILRDETPCNTVQSGEVVVPNDFKIVYSNGPTHGDWGVDKFTELHADGRYTVWELHPGQNDARNKTKKVISETILSSGKVKSIYAQVMACDFFTMKKEYATPGFKDGEYSQIFVRANGRSHRVSVHFYHVKRFESIKEALLSQGSSVSVQFKDQDEFDLPPDQDRKPEIKKDERYYVQVSDTALDKKEWQRAKQIIEEGLQKFPKSADLWHSRASYYFKSETEPKGIKPRETMRSMEMAYQLDPSAKHAAEMGWLYRVLQKDFEIALSYFEEAERKGHGREQKSLLYWMAWCYEKQGYYQLSKDYYRSFIQAAPKDEKAADARARLRRLR